MMGQTRTMHAPSHNRTLVKGSLVGRPETWTTRFHNEIQVMRMRMTSAVMRQLREMITTAISSPCQHHAA